MSASASDLLLAWLQTQLPAGVVAQTTPIVPGSGNSNGYYNADAGVGAASIVAPGIGIAVASTTTFLTGLYEVVADIAFTGGAPAAGDANNFVLYVGGASKVGLTIAPVANAAAKYRGVFRFNNQTASVRAGGVAGTAGVQYSATIIANKLAD